jgi:glycosyltransferase involved in cell wall biosynthesis
VGDHTARLAQALAPLAATTVITSRVPTLSEVPGVQVRPVFATDKATLVGDLADAVGKDPPDWLFVQYLPGMWQVRYGFNPFLPVALAQVRRRYPRVRIATLIHETFPAPVALRSALLASWLGPQLWAVGRLSDALFFVRQPSVERCGNWFPRTPMFHLPVGSNVDVLRPTPRVQTRRERGIDDNTTVLGLFGRIGPTRALDLVRTAAERLLAAQLKVLIYYVGFEADAVKRTALSRLPLLAEGPLEQQEVSRRLSAVDIYLMPIAEGVATCRTTLMAGMAHGLAIVGTSGPVTDPVLHEHDGVSLLLADRSDPSSFADQVLALACNPGRRNAIAASGLALFEREFTWSRIAERVTAALHEATRRRA